MWRSSHRGCGAEPGGGESESAGCYQTGLLEVVTAERNVEDLPGGSRGDGGVGRPRG